MPFKMALEASVVNLICEYENGENCLTWARAIGLSGTKDDRDLILTLATADSATLREFDDLGEDPHGAHLTRRAAADILAKRLVLVYKCNIFGEFKEGQRHLELGQRELKAYVDSGSLPGNYLHGMQCAFNGAAIHHVIIKAQSRSCHLSKRLVTDTVKKVKKLTEIITGAEHQELIGLYILKYYFGCKLSRSRSRGCKEELMQNLHRLLDLEPDNYEWWLLLYKRLEQERCSWKVKIPSLRERHALEKAMVLLEESGQSDNDVDSCCMMYIAAELRNKKYFSRDNLGFRKLEIGSICFSSRQEATNHLKEKAEMLIEMENHFKSPLIVAGRVFSSVLPEDLRNYNLAVGCCEKVLQKLPKYPKALELLGQIYQKQGSEDASRYFLEAYELDKSMVYCLLDAIGVLLWNPLKFEDQLKKLFAELNENDILKAKANDVYREKMGFYKGMFYLMLDDQVEGMEQLKAAFENLCPRKVVRFYEPLCQKLNLKNDQKLRIQASMNKYIQEHSAVDLKVRRLKDILKPGSRIRFESSHDVQDLKL